MPVTVDTVPSAADAARALSASRGARVLGGGTILMRAVNEADPAVERLIRIADPALGEVRSAGGTLVLGAAVTMARLLRDREAAFLAPVARAIGGPQVRSAATVAGNLFAPPPYGDFAAALIALGASVETADGRRTPVEDVARPGGARTLVTALHVPVPRGPLVFAKSSRVRPKGVSVLSIAAVLPRPAGRISGARIVFNGMGPRPMRAPGAERALEGGPLDAASIARAAAAATEGLEPADDALATAWYRRAVAPVHLTRLLEGAR